MRCTHAVLYVKDLRATHDFYVRILACLARRYAPKEDFLSIAVGNFAVNFYGPKLSPMLAAGYSEGVGHLGFEVGGRAEVERYFDLLQRTSYSPLGSTMQTLETLVQLSAAQTPGPNRFYVLDPDGYRVEIHTWEGVEE